MKLEPQLHCELGFAAESACVFRGDSIFWCVCAGYGLVLCHQRPLRSRLWLLGSRFVCHFLVGGLDWVREGGGRPCNF